MTEGEGFARRVTLSNLNSFAPLLRGNPNASEDGLDPDLDRANQQSVVDPTIEVAEELFVGQHLQVPKNYRRRGVKSGQGRERGTTPPYEESPQRSTSRGRLLWQKANLPPSDVQRQTGNVTGGVRLTKAGYRDAEGNLIDQTTYFRREVFGNLDWEMGRDSPYREDTVAEFVVSLNGEHEGRYELRVSHKPSGEAGQANYTTMLHWGDLSTIVRDLDLVGRTLSLYGPATGTIGPYHLVVD